eukprot:TRINITY_DN6165_c0_g1_i1.p2 TRINITY_DN6165_c0_g1~~TRINITY_DN6165_c0_g1_i1.p2  ORF type:complete len:147 (+),score=50.25 TRINITY_DN6165_c0_g1_i1:613-1053(+)
MIIKSGLRICNLQCCKLAEKDMGAIILLTYSLNSSKLETILVGDNQFSKEFKESIISRGILFTPNTFIDFTNDLNNKECLGTIFRRLKDKRRMCEVLKFVEEPEKIKNKRFAYFYGSYSILAAIGFGYLELLLKAKAIDSFKNLYS